MRKTLSIVTVVVLLGISTSAVAAPRRDSGGNIVQQIIAKLRSGVVRALDEIGWPKP